MQNVYLVIVLLHLSGVASREKAEMSGSTFWLTAELLTINWRLGCLNTGGCADPRFKLIETNQQTNEKMAISWPITADLVQDNSRPFVSHWIGGAYDDIQLTCEIVGLDPTYGFPRICDATPSMDLFQMKVQAKRGRRDSDLSSDNLNGRLLVEVKGKCFNATLAVAKHLDRCPWCRENEMALISPQSGDGEIVRDLLHQLRNGESLLQLGVLILAAISISAITAFACLLIAYLRSRRMPKRPKLPKIRTGVYHEHLYAEPLQPAGCLKPSKYETPWEAQQLPPIPPPPPQTMWYGGMQRSIAPSSGDSRTLVRIPYDNHRLDRGNVTTFSRSSQRDSPNTSMVTSNTERHDDSGLESV